MGTSSSSKGSGGTSPLIPAWAAPDGTPVPAPAGGQQRFRSFRTQLGKAATGGGRPALSSALGHYSRSAMGGAATGSRRFTPITSVGGALLHALRFPQAAPGAAAPTVDLAALAGQPVRTAIEAIVAALTPTNGDADRIRLALDEALSQTLQGVAQFDPVSLTEDQIASMVIEYLAQSIFLHIVSESGTAFDKTADAVAAVASENDLLEMVRAAVENRASDLVGAAAPVSAADAARVQNEIIKQVLMDWEAYR